MKLNDVQGAIANNTDKLEIVRRKLRSLAANGVARCYVQCCNVDQVVNGYDHPLDITTLIGRVNTYGGSNENTDAWEQSLMDTISSVVYEQLKLQEKELIAKLNVLAIDLVRCLSEPQQQEEKV